MASLMDLATDPNAQPGLSLLNSPVLGMAQGLLAASGASRLPVTMGAALGSGLGQAQAVQDAALRRQAAVQQLVVGQYAMARARLMQKLLEQAAGGQGAPQASAGPASAQSAPGMSPGSSQALFGTPAFATGQQFGTGNQVQSGAAPQQPADGGMFPQIPGMSPEQSMLANLGIIPPGVVSAVSSANSPTDIVKNMRAAGINPNSAEGQKYLTGALNKATIIPPVRGYGGGYYMDPVTRALTYLPKLPEGAYPVNPNNPSAAVAKIPGAAEVAGAMAAAQSGGEASGRFPYSTVTTPSGATVPAFTVPGLVSPGITPNAATINSGLGAEAERQNPHAAQLRVLQQELADQQASGKVDPALEREIQRLGGTVPAAASAPAVGQSTVEKSYGEAAAKAGSDYQNALNDQAASALTQNRMLDELQNSLKNITPGKLAAVKKSIAEWKMAVGLGTPEDQKIAASSEVADKLTGQIVSQALRSMSARPSQMEFAIFLNKFVPNLNLTPQGAEQVIDFMRQQNNLALLKQQQFQKWRKGQSPADYRDFEAVWNPQAAATPLQAPASFGTTPGSEQPKTPVPGGPMPSAQDIVNEMRKRGLVK